MIFILSLLLKDKSFCLSCLFNIEYEILDLRPARSKIKPSGLKGLPKGQIEFS